MTNVPSLQPGYYLAAAATAFNIVSSDHVWVAPAREVADDREAALRRARTKALCQIAKRLAKMADIPTIVQLILQLLADQLRSLDEKIARLDQELAHRVKEDAEAKRDDRSRNRTYYRSRACCVSSVCSGLQERP